MTTTTPPALKTLSLTKGRHTFVFRYAPGDEPQVLDALAELARGRTLPFDWFDAAVLSHQLGQQLSQELRDVWPK